MGLICSALRYFFKIWQYERDQEVHQKHVCFSVKKCRSILGTRTMLPNNRIHSNDFEVLKGMKVRD